MDAKKIGYVFPIGFLPLIGHVIEEIPHIPLIYGTTEFKKWTVQKDLKTNGVYN